MDIATLGIRVTQQGIREARRDLDGLTASGAKAESAVGLLRSAFAGLAAGLGSISLLAVGREIIQVADQFTAMSGRLQVATGSSKAAAAAMQDIYDIAQRTRSGLSDTAGLFTKLTLATQALGATQAEVAGVTETINQAMVVSGASSASASAGIQQLSQAFASGVLRGDEFNSVMENSPRLAKALSDAMGVSVGQLRAMAEQGSLTAEAVFEALQSQAQAIQAEFDQMSTTVAQAMTQIGNQLSKYIGDMNEATGATDSLVAIIQDLGVYVGVVTNAIDDANKAYARYADSTADASSATYILRIAFEAIVVTGANVLYVFSAIAKDIGSVVSQINSFLKGDYVAVATEGARRAREAWADRAGIDAFSKSLVEGGKAAATYNESMRIKRDMDRASAEAARVQWGLQTEANTATHNGAKAALAASEASRQRAAANREAANAAREAAQAERELAQAVEQARQSMASEWERAAAQSTETMAALVRGYDKGLVSVDELAKANLKLSGHYELEAVKVEDLGGKILTMNDILAASGVEVDNLRSQWQSATDAMSDAFEGVAGAVDDVFRAISNQNWGRALASLTSAFGAIGQSMSSVGLLGTIGNVAGAAAPYVGGGKFGRALNGLSAAGQIGSLMGAGSLFGAGSAGLFGGTTIAPMVVQSMNGAALAGTFGAAGGLSGAMAGIGGALASNPIGWIVGAGILASTLLGGNAKRRRERRASENEAAANAIEGIQAQAAQKFALEIQILELSGKTAEAVAKQRAEELSKLDATSKALQEQIYKLSDLKDELAKLEDQVGSARSELTSAYQREAGALQSVIDTFATLADSLAAYSQTLRGQLAANDNQSLAYTRGRFRSTASMALSGDQSALAALQAVGEEYRAAAMASATDRVSYARSLAEIMTTVDAAQGMATSRVDTAREQLMSLQTMVGGLITINESTISVREAVDNLTRLEAARAAKEAEMQAAASAATAGIGAGGSQIVTDFAAYVRKNPDLMALYSSNSGMARGRTIEEFGAYHYANYGAAEIAAGARKFNTGGSFTVGGSGGTDTTPVSFMATPGEVVNVSRQDSMGKMAAALERQNALLMQQNALLRQTADATDKTSKILTRVTRDGESLLTEAA